MTGSMHRARRAGNLLLVIAILSAVMFVAMFSLGFLTRTDVTTSSFLMREVQATHLAESIAAQVEAHANSRPWSKRFWFLEALAAGTAKKGDGIAPAFPFDTSTKYVNVSRDSLPAADYEFVGVIKDLPTELWEYRLFVEVTLRGERYAFTWDKRWDQGLLSAMSRDATLLDKPLEGIDVGLPPVDTLIDTIKDQAKAAPPPEGANPPQQALIGDLREDEGSFDATAIPPDPGAPPKVPAPPNAAPFGIKDGKFK